jgi:sulfur carrier protein
LIKDKHFFYAIDRGEKMKVNGKDMKFKENKNILSLLNDFEISKDKVVVEVNFDILEEEEFQKYILKEEDVVELINFVGGG